MSLRVVFGVVTLATIGACSLFSSLDGFSGEGNDAGAATSEGGPSGDANATPETSTTTDASSDGGDARTTFCSTRPDAALCEDFDHDDPLGAWKQTTNPGASFAVLGDAGRSPPNAIRATVTPFTASRGTYIAHPLAIGTVSHARLSYALFVEERPSTYVVEISLLRFTGCTNGCWSDFYVGLRNGDSVFAEQGWDGSTPLGTEYTLAGAIPTGKWVRIGFEMILTGAKQMILSVDDIEISRKTLTMTGAGEPAVNMGITYAGSSAPSASVLIDDVVFEVLP